MYISVIVPVYNTGVYLQNTLAALHSQTLESGIEFILIDDGSTDGSPAVCDRYAAEDGRFIVLHKKNAGVSAARNDGMRMARGRYLMFSDADDIPHPDMAEKLLEKAEETGADIVLSGFTRQKNGRPVDEPFPYEGSMQDRAEIMRRLVMPMAVWGYAPGGMAYKSIYGSVWRGLYKKELIEKHGIEFPLGIRLGEDMLFNMMAFLHAEETAFIGDCLYTYIENSASATHTGRGTLWARYKLLWDQAHDILLKEGASSGDIAWHNFQLCRYAISVIVEAVCPADMPAREKRAYVKELLSDSELRAALSSLPGDIGGKDRMLTRMMKPSMAGVLLRYYRAR